MKECDRMQREYHAFLQEVTVKNNTTFKEIQCDKKRLDTFLVTFTKADASFGQYQRRSS